MSDTRFYRYKQFLVDTYGAALYRVPVDLGFGCPHRNTDGSSGCTFCPGDGSRAAQTLSADSIEDQVRAGVAFARKRYRAEHFMAYLQAFTATFAPVAEQEALFRRVLDTFRFEALSVGTRPDCLPADALDLLSRLREETDVWVELGVQTVHDATLQRIRRGHDWETSRAAILALHQRGIRVAVHVILGLPGEGPEEFRATADTLARLPVCGIKIHNLHVVAETDLAKEYARRAFPVYSEEDYARVLIDFLRRLPPSVPIIRMTTDTAAARLIAPRWHMDKSRFLQYVSREMARQDVRQGDLFASLP